MNERLRRDDAEDRPARLAAIAEEFETYIRTSGVQADLRHEKTRGDGRRRVREELRRRMEALRHGNEDQQIA